MEYTVANLFYIKRDKAAFRSILKWITREEEPQEIPLAKTLSSVITHILIEMENARDSEDAVNKADGFRLDLWNELLYKCISGTISVEDIMSKVKVMIEEV